MGNLTRRRRLEGRANAPPCASLHSAVPVRRGAPRVDGTA